MVEAVRRKNGDAAPEAAPPTPEKKPPSPQAPQLTIDDVNAMLADYQQQITQCAGRNAGMAMELARAKRRITELEVALAAK